MPPLMPSLTTSRLEKLKRYVLSRQSDDGGFAMCNPLPSSLAETFYAVHIFKALKWEIPRKNRLVEYLETNLRKEVYSIYYVFSSLKALDCEIPEEYCEFLLERLGDVLKRSIDMTLGDEGRDESCSERGITVTYSFESPNVLREIHCIAASLEICNRELPEEVGSFVEKFRKNGGYGAREANLRDTFFCVSILKPKDVRIANFVRQHRCPQGGFAKRPGSFPPYIEETYYALSTFHELGYGYKDEETARYVVSLQNPDGGFRRSIYLGISSLENTFYAVKSLEMLSLTGSRLRTSA